MNNFVFKITFKQQLASLSWMLSVWGIIFSIYLYFFGFTFQSMYVYIIGPIFFLPDVVPTLIVHIQYLRKNWGTILIIDRSSKILEYKSPKANLQYHFDDITTLQRIVSYGEGQWYSFRNYTYFKIIFKDKTEIIITSLMMRYIKFNLEILLGIQAQKKFRIVAFVY